MSDRLTTNKFLAKELMVSRISLQEHCKTEASRAEQPWKK
jgi:hypothetical protein